MNKKIEKCIDNFCDIVILIFGIFLIVCSAIYLFKLDSSLGLIELGFYLGCFAAIMFVTIELLISSSILC